MSEKNSWYLSKNVKVWSVEALHFCLFPAEAIVLEIGWNTRTNRSIITAFNGPSPVPGASALSTTLSPGGPPGISRVACSVSN